VRRCRGNRWAGLLAISVTRLAWGRDPR